MNFLIGRMNIQAIQLWFAEGISDNTGRQCGNVKYSQVGLVIAWFTGLAGAVQVGLEAEH